MPQQKKERGYIEDQVGVTQVKIVKRAGGM